MTQSERQEKKIFTEMANSRVFVVLVVLGLSAIAAAEDAPAPQQEQEVMNPLARLVQQIARARRQNMEAAGSADGSGMPQMNAGGSMSTGGGNPFQNLFHNRYERINDGVGTIVGGAMGGDLEQILRGSFKIPTSPHVRTVASGVLDAVFGNRPGP